MVSASLVGSSMPFSETRTSGAIFLFSLIYCSNWLITVRPSASSSALSASWSGIASVNASKYESVSLKEVMRARRPPSTSTLTVPSGSFSSCRIVDTVPIRKMSSAVGSSCAAFFCATRRICLSSFITASSARTDFSRPTNSGTIMCGNTTMSRSGSTASASLRAAGRVFSESDMQTSYWTVGSKAPSLARPTRSKGEKPVTSR